MNKHQYSCKTKYDMEVRDCYEEIDGTKDTFMMFMALKKDEFSKHSTQ